MSSLERAIIIAAEAHTGQVDKAGVSYILHPLRLMLQMKTDVERIVAVLHDVVEDSHWTLALLRAEGFSEQILLGNIPKNSRLRLKVNEKDKKQPIKILVG